MSVNQDVATQHPELMPRYLDVNAATRDMNLFISLNAVLQMLSELEQMVKDTHGISRIRINPSIPDYEQDET